MICFPVFPAKTKKMALFPVNPANPAIATTLNEEVNNITPGDAVWGMCGRMWYPAKVRSLTDVPENMCNIFHNNRKKLMTYLHSHLFCV